MPKDKFEIAYGLADIVMQAGAIARERFQAKIQIEHKGDGSAVTEVDFAVDEMLTAYAREVGIGYLSEESVGSLDHDLILYADPLDGTQAFIDGQTDFTVVMTLMERMGGNIYTPLASYIYQPMTNTLWKSIGTDGTIKSEDDKNGKFTYMFPPTPEASIAVVMPKRSRFGKARAKVLAAIGEESDLEFTRFGSTGYIGAMLASGVLHGAIFGHEDAHEITAMSQIIRCSRQQSGMKEGFLCDFNGKPLMNFTLEQTGEKARFVVPNGTIFASTPHLATRLLAIVKDAL